MYFLIKKKSIDLNLILIQLISKIKVKIFQKENNFNSFKEKRLPYNFYFKKYIKKRLNKKL